MTKANHENRTFALTLAIVAVVGAAALIVPGCASIAVATAPARTAAPSTEKAKLAEQRFFTVFQSDKYEELDGALEELTAAYGENPRDARITFLLGLAHMWRLGERERATRANPMILTDLVVARSYFEEAAQLSPEDDRIPGYLSTVEMALGKVHQDERTMRTGYFRAKDAVGKYPEFNMFILGSGLSRGPADDPKTLDAANMLWKNVDICYGTNTDPAKLDAAALQQALAQYPSANVSERNKRACGNSDVAPHNIESFLLLLADVEAKLGRKENAATLYTQAIALPSAQSWKLKGLVEERLAGLDARVAAYQADPKAALPTFQSTQCTACHAR